MKFRDASAIAALAILVLLLLAACGALEPTSTPIPPGPAPTPRTATTAPSAQDWPSARKYGAMVYDPISKRIFMLGGELTSKSADDISDEVWSFDPSINEWQRVAWP